MNLTKLCIDALKESNRVLNSVKDGHQLASTQKHETVTKGDLAVSRSMVEFFKHSGVPAILYSEESGRIELSGNPKYMIAFDDIDGSDNYNRGISRYCSLVGIFDSVQPRFKDALVAGVIDHVTGEIYHAVRRRGCFLNGKRVRTSGKQVNNKKTVLVLETFKSGEDIGKFSELFNNAWIKNFGSAAYHFACVASGKIDGYIHLVQKGDELGAGYLLVKEAGGYLADIEGKTIGKEPYDFNGVYKIVAAATPQLGKALLSRIKL